MKYTGIKITKLIALVAVLAVSSANQLTAAETNAPVASAATAAAPASTAPKVIGVKELFQDPYKLDGQEVVLQGFVTDYCKKKGCWAMLHDKDSDAQGVVRVKQDEEGPTFKPFLPELQGKTILVKGKVQTTKIDTNYLDKWELRVKSGKPVAEDASTKASDEAKSEAAEKSEAATLKQIAALRERVAKSKKGYLTSTGFAVTSWEPQAEQK